MSETLNPVGVTGLLAAVPYLLGYRPSEALVIVVLREMRVALTMCASLEELAVVLPVEKVQLAIKRAQGTGIAVIGYSHDLDDELAETIQSLALEIEPLILQENTLGRDHDQRNIPIDGAGSHQPDVFQGSEFILKPVQLGRAEKAFAPAHPLQSRRQTPVIHHVPR